MQSIYILISCSPDAVTVTTGIYIAWLGRAWTYKRQSVEYVEFLPVFRDAKPYINIQIQILH